MTIDLWSKIAAMVGELMDSLDTLDMSIFFSDFSTNNVSFSTYIMAIAGGVVLVDALLWGITGATKQGKHKGGYDDV